MAANVDVALPRRRARRRLQPAAHRALPGRRVVQRGRRRWSCSTRRMSPTTSTSAGCRGRGGRAGRADRRRLGAGPATGSRRSCATPPTRAATAVILGSSGVGKSTLVNALLGEDRQRTAAGPRATTRAAGTRRRTASCSSCPAARCSSTRPGSARSRCSGPTTGSRARSTTSRELAAACRFNDCGHDERARLRRRGPRSPTGASAQERLASHQKLERELAQAARETDPRARAEDRRTSRLNRKAAKASDAQAARKERAEQ